MTLTMPIHHAILENEIPTQEVCSEHICHPCDPTSYTPQQRVCHGWLRIFLCLLLLLLPNKSHGLGTLHPVAGEYSQSDHQGAAFPKNVAPFLFGRQSERIAVMSTPSLPSAWACRGIRGATTCTENTREAILEATRELLMVIVRLNEIIPEEVGSAFLTTTADLNAEFPAVAARQIGWHDVPLLCAHEMNVPHSLPMCIRVMIMWNTAKRQDEVLHVYLREATSLRPDRSLEMPELIAQIQKEISQLPNE